MPWNPVGWSVPQFIAPNEPGTLFGPCIFPSERADQNNKRGGLGPPVTISLSRSDPPPPEQTGVSLAPALTLCSRALRTRATVPALGHQDECRASRLLLRAVRRRASGT